MTGEQFDRLIQAIENIAHGSQHAPGGLEMVAIGLTGDGNIGRDSVSGSLSLIAEAIGEHAAAVLELGNAGSVAYSLDNIAEAIGQHARAVGDLAAAVRELGQ